MLSEPPTPAESADSATGAARPRAESGPAPSPRRRRRLAVVVDVVVGAVVVAAATALMLSQRSGQAAGTPAAGPSGTWIVGLAEIPRTTDREERDQQVAEFQQRVPGASLVDSDTWASLPPDAWVVRAPGEFADGFEALAYCDRLGSEECSARYLSHDEDDQGYVCEAAPAPDPEACRHPGDRTESAPR
ncbi:hypothetical protein ACIQWA_02305 [Kitasatospora sp. NPDC098652]|uniref:hypothetical protein n=1 Tax=Kitasatospora sp. NPDC098652 TaxID=3364095 RepID=UPI00381E4A1B